MNYGLNLFHLPFTSFAAELFCLGFFLLYTSARKMAGPVFALIGTILLCFSLLWRQEAFLLMIPFGILCIVSDIVTISKQERKNLIRRIVCYFIPLVVINSACIAINRNVNSSEKYSASYAYNDARSLLVDYEQQSWKNAKTKLKAIGVSENDYKAINALILADTSVIDTDYMNKIYLNSSFSITQKAESFIEHGFSDWFNSSINSYFLLQIILELALFLIFCLYSDDLIKKFLCACSFPGALIMCLYFTFEGHMMTYIMQSVLFGILLVITLSFFTTKIRSAEIKKWDKCFLAAAFIVFICYYSYQPTTASNIFASFSAKDSDVTDVISLDNGEDNMYVWSVYDFDTVTAKSYNFLQYKLPSEELLNHNIVDGEWEYGQLYYLDYQERIDMQNPMLALLNKENTYYVGSEARCKIILKYLQEHYDSNVTVESVDNDAGVLVWKFSK